jgi:hypothetical protein
MALFQFGSGVLLGARTDIAPSTPVNFGLVQDVTFDIAFGTKQLFGQNQFPVAVARGTGKITGKAKMAQISGLAFNNLFFGQTLSAGSLATAFGESQTIAAGSATAANGGSFVDDYGVLAAATGLPFIKVASAPAIGQYSGPSPAGLYTFNTGDNGKAILLSYTFNQAGAATEQIIVSNQLLGTTPTFQMQLYGGTYQGKPVNVKFFNCVSTKLAYATRLEDFVIPEIDFDVFANAAGAIANWSFAEAS